MTNAGISFNKDTHLAEKNPEILLKNSTHLPEKKPRQTKKVRSPPHPPGHPLKFLLIFPLLKDDLHHESTSLNRIHVQGPSV